MTAQAWILIAAIAAVLLVAFVSGFVLYKRRRVTLTPAAPEKELTDRSGGYQASGGFSFTQGGAGASTLTRPEPEPVPLERTDDEGQPHVGDDAAVPRDSVRRTITDVRLPEPDTAAEAAVEEEVVGEEVAEDTAATATDTTAPGTTAADGTLAPEAPAKEAAPGHTAPPTDTAPAAKTPAPSEIEAPEQTSATTGTAAPEETRGTTGTTGTTGTAGTAAQRGASAPASAPDLEEIEPTAGRLTRLRGRLSRSQNAVGKSLLGLLGGGDLDEDSWEEIEDTLVMADLGTASTGVIVQRLREEMAARSVRTDEQARQVLRDVLIEALRPELDRSIRALPHDDHPSILLVVGVNGTGKTTTTGKLARVLVADGRRVLLGAADTFRAAAADQLQTWGERVGAETVRGREGADPASVAFDAVSTGIGNGVDVVLVDTAGRLHTKTGLMDELGKVKRVVEKKAAVDEVLLVLDATVGQNGLTQARVFAEVVDITGVVLTKLDGTAKGGIVFQVQHELGVPVKLVGLGEGADDLAPFEPSAFVDALLG
ncbi:signal recognition particle-docking protein FtsY [Nocardia blacklockiae]|uniref:signal recognition particle-docking protein FtsY n=1 Tax=Nocardia blacklockiae TaxID=480036 RepID=UPI0018930B0A|nr:signal recognition particle-docking protein FtsY [Nocardia blacklockiae]MBF6173799.1 signal recognition particle-docking protein FtsY [Nocardia blacklockiae]